MFFTTVFSILLALFSLRSNQATLPATLYQSQISRTLDDTITWSAARRLTWSDFRGKPIVGSSSVALTSSGIGMEYFGKSNGTPVINVRCDFFCSHSWVKDAGKNDSVLQHEQLHFDITELYARKLRQRIAQLKPEERKPAALRMAYADIDRACNDRQNRYDNETHHGTERKAQLAWIKQVNGEMQALEQYASR